MQPVALLEPRQRNSHLDHLHRRPVPLPAPRRSSPIARTRTRSATAAGSRRLTGVKHDSYFTDEARYYFVYDGTAGISLSFFGDDDLFIFINGVLVLDLGGVHQQLPGKVTVTGEPGRCARSPKAAVSMRRGTSPASRAGSTRMLAHQRTTPAATARTTSESATVKLGLITGKVYEIAIFGADRHPPESNYQLTLQGFTTKRSDCAPRCGDGVVVGRRGMRLRRRHGHDARELLGPQRQSRVRWLHHGLQVRRLLRRRHQERDRGMRQRHEQRRLRVQCNGLRPGLQAARAMWRRQGADRLQ